VDDEPYAVENSAKPVHDPVDRAVNKLAPPCMERL
jgi:hypothetical protein